MSHFRGKGPGPVLRALALAGICFVLSACDRSPSQLKDASSSTVPASPAGVPTTAVSSTTTTAIGVSPTVLATSRRCASDGLRLIAGNDLDSLMRQSGAYFGLKNTSETACTMRGYPTVEFFDQAEHPIKTRGLKGGGYHIHDPGLAPVTLGPDDTGWFGMNWVVENVEKGNSDGCVLPAAIGVIAPGGSRQLRMAVDFQAPPCLVSGFSVTALGTWDSFAHGATGPPIPRS